MKSLFWKLFYRVWLGKSYETSVESAAKIGKSIFQATQGGIKFKYDAAGNALRENHSRLPHSARHNDEHPLVTKYGH